MPSQRGVEDTGVTLDTRQKRNLIMELDCIFYLFGLFATCANKKKSGRRTKKSGRAGPGRAGPGRAGPGRAGAGQKKSGRVGPGRAGPENEEIGAGRDGPGRARPGQQPKGAWPGRPHRAPKQAWHARSSLRYAPTAPPNSKL